MNTSFLGDFGYELAKRTDQIVGSNTLGLDHSVVLPDCEGFVKGFLAHFGCGSDEPITSVTRCLSDRYSPVQTGVLVESVTSPVQLSEEERAYVGDMLPGVRIRFVRKMAHADSDF